MQPETTQSFLSFKKNKINNNTEHYFVLMYSVIKVKWEKREKKIVMAKNIGTLGKYDQRRL